MSLIDSSWRYDDTGELVSENPNRVCNHCSLPNTLEGHDGCIGTLLGVMNACCGHGRSAEAYVQYHDGRTIRGEDALKVQSNNKQKAG